MKDKNKHTVGDEKDALSSFLVSSVPCRGGGDISLTGRRDGACAVQPLPSFLGPPSCRGRGFWCVRLYPFPVYTSKRLSC